MKELIKNKQTDKSLEKFNNIINLALSIPGAKINRETFLRKELSKHCDNNTVELAIKKTPAKAKINKEIIEKISNSVIKLHTWKVAALSGLAGMPGGFWVIGTIPADLVQYFYNVLQVLQKLAYLYGWPDLFYENKSNLDDETVLILALFLGVMFGLKQASDAIRKLAGKIANQVIERLPRKALTKYGIYNLAKQIGRWIGLKITKESFSKFVSKMVPIIGGFASGGISYIAFRTMAKRLKKHLQTLPIAQ